MREIEIDVPAPGREVGVLDRNVDIAAADIVDENIDRRRLGEHAPAKILACRGLSDVGRKNPGLALAFPHLAGGPGEGFGVARDKQDVGARLRGGKRDRTAEATAAPRDQYALAVQSEAIEHGHVVLPGGSCRAFILADNVGPQIAETPELRIFDSCILRGHCAGRGAGESIADLTAANQH